MIRRYGMKALSIFLLCGVLLTCSAAQAEEKRVYDNGNLFSDSERASLEKEIRRFQDETGMDFVMLTSKESLQDVESKAAAIADEFYDEGGFGLDDEHSGVLYYINTGSNRYHYLSTTGKMIDYLTDARIKAFIDGRKSTLAAGNYSLAALAMLEGIQRYIRDGIPQGQYRYDIVTGRQLTARHKALTFGELMISLAAGLVVSIVFIIIVTRRYKLKGSTYAYAFRQNSDMDLLEKEDQFLRTTTTQRRKPDPSSNQSGGGGGSGVHSGSSGTSHGGGGGRF